VRRTEEHHLAEVPQPIVPRQTTVVAGAACNQAAHAVSDNDQLLHRHRPGVQQDLDQAGKGAAVDGNVQPAVVVQIHRRERGVCGQGRPVVVPLAPPLQSFMHSPCTSRRILPLGRGIAAARPRLVMCSGCPSRRKRMGIASGLPLTAM